MLKYIFRYEIARLIFGPAGIVIAALTYILFGSAITWAIQNWLIIVLAITGIKILINVLRRR